MPNLLTYILLIWILIANIIGFALMGIDKRRAQRDMWRISEKQLFIPALLGGTIGAILGMHHFRHKTKHWYFWRGLPALLVLQITASIWFYWLLWVPK